MKVEDLTGALLDYWAALANESWRWAHELFPTMTLDPTFIRAEYRVYSDTPACMLVPTNAFRQDTKVFAPSTYWEHGGPIIERARIATRYGYAGTEWSASFAPLSGQVLMQEGPTLLIAAMRVLVASKFGDDVPVS